MQVQSYLFFDGRTEEAIEFYKRAIGAEVESLMRFKDAPPRENSATDGPFTETKEVVMAPPPGAEDKVLHASFRVGDTRVMASDGECGGRPSFQGFSLAITVPTVDKARRLFAALVEGGQVQAPLTKTFFSPSFGMLFDRFGVHWMVYVVGPAN
jgi:PhnB protein